MISSLSTIFQSQGHIYRFHAEHLLHRPGRRLGPQRQVNLEITADLVLRVEEYLTGKNLVDKGVFKEAIHLVRHCHPSIHLGAFFLFSILFSFTFFCPKAGEDAYGSQRCQSDEDAYKRGQAQVSDAVTPP